MNDILNDLIHLNLQECKEVLRAVQDRIKILEDRQRLANQVGKLKNPPNEEKIS